MKSKKQQSRTRSADQARAEANAVIDKVLSKTGAPAEVKASRKAQLTKYPAAVRAARDQNDAHDVNDAQRSDERAPAQTDHNRDEIK